MCRVLEVSTSGYYAWRGREPSARARSDQQLIEQMRDIHRWSRGTYGSPRMHVELNERGTDVGLHQVARVMRVNGLRGVCRRKGWRTTVRDERLRPAPDLVQRSFTASAPDELWVADITYVPTGAGFLFLATVLDVFSRRVVGWAMATHLRTELVLEALNMALSQRHPTDVIHHSDQGSQYTSIAFGKRCEAYGVRPSMGSVGDCYDNAMAESFFATLECELIERVKLRTTSEAKREVFSYIEGWYNPHRRHSSIDYCSPAQFEKRYHDSQCGHQEGTA
jgi:putative transposase